MYFKLTDNLLALKIGSHLADFDQKYGYKIEHTNQNLNFKLYDNIGSEECARFCLSSEVGCSGFDTCLTNGLDQENASNQQTNSHSCTIYSSQTLAKDIDSRQLSKDPLCSTFLLSRNDYQTTNEATSDDREIDNKHFNTKTGKKVKRLNFWQIVVALSFGSFVGICVVLIWRRRGSIWAVSSNFINFSPTH